MARRALARPDPECPEVFALLRIPRARRFSPREGARSGDMAAIIVCALCALVVLKPQEFLHFLSGIPLLHIGLALFFPALAADVLRRRVKLALAPHVPYVVAFFVWGTFVTLVKKPSALPKEGIDLAIVLCLFLVVATGAGTPKGLLRFCATFLACALFATGVAIAQSQGPLGCMIAAQDDWEGKGELEYDGRGCETTIDCRKDAPLPDANYRCERVGPLGTATIGGRVRYRGTLADPNELSLAAAMALPFALALAERRASRSERRRTQSAAALPPLLTNALLDKAIAWLRGVPALACILSVGCMIVLSQSRMGVIVFVLVLGMAFVRRAGALGVVLGLLAFPPLLLLGGRSGAEAEASADERLDLVGEALQMARRSRGFGLGLGQFANESSTGLTAHNSYLLATAETGIVGACLFSLALYGALKVPIALWFGPYELGRDLRRLAPAIAIALAGSYVGIFFLSWSYKEFLYMMLGASAALHQAARAEDERVHVKIAPREAALVCALCLTLLPLLWLALHFVA